MKKNQNVTFVGVDVGYGYTKALKQDGAAVVFPSVAAHMREQKWNFDELMKRHPGDLLMDDDGDWMIGTLAASDHVLDGLKLRLRGRTGNEQQHGNTFRVRMLKAALGKLFPGLRNGEAVHLSVSTGLPVDHMRDAADLKAALIGQHRVQNDLTDFVANITEVRVMPQPYGTIYSRMITNTGELDECYTYTSTGVIDVGTYTVDIALDNDGEYVDVRSGSSESGVYVVQNEIRDAFNRDFRATLDSHQIDEVLRSGCIRVQGKPINYTHEVQAATKPLQDAVVNLVANRWQGATNIDVIYLTGGGAYMVEQAIGRLYPQAMLLDDAQLANCRGYLNFALFAATNS